MMEHLYERLKNYSESDYYGFHMPGHKRNKNVTGAELPYEIDITEIEGFDDLHHAEGILKELQNYAAKVFHADETHYLVNGSTVGLLSAVMGCTERGGKILTVRNCHKSVYNAIYMNELEPVYIYPQFDTEQDLNGEIKVEELKEILASDQDRKIQAVVITSPTYDGVVSDVEAIAEAVHEYNLPLIVDEAHGAHFGFHTYFPENSNVKGADLVIHSLHKTLPSLTQTALLHMNQTDGKWLFDCERVRMYLHMLQSSSPSYVLMASIDECVHILEEKREEIFQPYIEKLDAVRKQLLELKKLKLLETRMYDKSKLVISVKNTACKSGRKLSEILFEKYHLQMEMAAGSYMIAMTAPGDTEDGMERLVSALQEIDNELQSADRVETKSQDKSDQSSEIKQLYENEKGVVPKEKKDKSKYRLLHQKRKYICYEAMKHSGKSVALEESAGCVTLEYVYLYPPGIPILVPGEWISEETVEQIMEYEKAGFSIEGIREEGKIMVEVGSRIQSCSKKSF